MRAQEIGRVAHEVNRAYCEALGDTSPPRWEDAPAWQVESAIDGVLAVLEGRANSPEAQHRLWMESKAADGWTWGCQKDPEAKKHPCMVPYDMLPAAQRAKDYIFRGVVVALERYYDGLR